MLALSLRRHRRSRLWHPWQSMTFDYGVYIAFTGMKQASYGCLCGGCVCVILVHAGTKQYITGRTQKTGTYSDLQTATRSLKSSLRNIYRAFAVRKTGFCQNGFKPTRLYTSPCHSSISHGQHARSLGCIICLKSLLFAALPCGHIAWQRCFSIELCGRCWQSEGRAEGSSCSSAASIISTPTPQFRFIILTASTMPAPSCSLGHVSWCICRLQKISRAVVKMLLPFTTFFGSIACAGMSRIPKKSIPEELQPSASMHS